MQQLKMLWRERLMQCEARHDGQICVKVEMPCGVSAPGACLLKNWSKAEIFRHIIPFRDVSSHWSVCFSGSWWAGQEVITGNSGPVFTSVVHMVSNCFHWPALPVFWFVCKEFKLLHTSLKYIKILFYYSFMSVKKKIDL